MSLLPLLIRRRRSLRLVLRHQSDAVADAGGRLAVSDIARPAAPGGEFRRCILFELAYFRRHKTAPREIALHYSSVEFLAAPPADRITTLDPARRQASLCAFLIRCSKYFLLHTVGKKDLRSKNWHESRFYSRRNLVV